MQNIPLNETSTLHKIYTHNARKIPPYYPPATDPSATDSLVFTMHVYQPSGMSLPSPQPPTSTSTNTTQRFYPPFSATEPLESALSGTSFLEFPTIHVFLRQDWDRRVAEGRVLVLPLSRGTEREEKGAQARAEVRNKKARTEAGDHAPLSDPDHRPIWAPRPNMDTPVAKSTQEEPVATLHGTSLPTEVESAETPRAPAAPAAGLALDYGTESDEGA